MTIIPFGGKMIINPYTGQMIVNLYLREKVTISQSTRKWLKLYTLKNDC